MVPTQSAPSPALTLALQALEAMEQGFNTFEAAGLVTQEIRHSHFLAYMLNPHGKHGLGAAMTHAFVAELFGDGRTSPPGAWRVRREWQHIDLLLVDDERQRVFVVENKIDAGEHGDQLARYVDAVALAYPHHERKFALLSPGGSAPSHGEYIAAAYDAVARAFTNVLRDSDRKPRVRASIEDYLELLRRYVLPGTDTASTCRRLWRDHDAELVPLMDRWEASNATGDEDHGAEEMPQAAMDYPTAWAMLAANRPDIRQRTLALAHQLRSGLVDSHVVVPGYTSRRYVAFRPMAWLAELDRLHARGWVGLKAYPLYVELTVGAEGLWLDVWIAGSALPPLREACFAWARARGHLFPSLPAKLNRASISLHHEALLTKSDYGRGAWSDVEPVARARFDHFIAVTLPPIMAASVEIEWPPA